MKIEQIEPEPIFKPVVITLQTQHEVDALFASVNYTPLANVLKLPQLWAGLRPYRNVDNTGKLHTELMAMVRHEQQ